MKAFEQISGKEKAPLALQPGQKADTVAIQCKGFEARTSYPLPPVQRKPNRTGLPDHLKAGVESLSGYSMDDVKVHYDSDKPAQLEALAYAQGTDIHVAPGQEQHLPHEAWHVVQQKQGRVQPTMQTKGGVGINDDTGLEREADNIGAKVNSPVGENYTSLSTSKSPASVVQRVKGKKGKEANVRALGGDDKLYFRKNKADNAVYKSEDDKKNAVWVKLNEDVGKTKAASDFINDHAPVIAGNPAWNISTPSIRYGTEDDKGNMAQALRNGHIDKHSEASDVSNEDLAMAAEAANVLKLSVASSATGTGPEHFEKKGGSKKYFKALGKMQLLDYVLGNDDRGIGSYNPDNYLVSNNALKKSELQMIDNVPRGGLEQSGFGSSKDKQVYEHLQGNKDELTTLFKDKLMQSLGGNPTYQLSFASKEFKKRYDEASEFAKPTLMGDNDFNKDFLENYVKGFMKAKDKLPQTRKKMQERHDESSDNEYKTAMGVMMENIRMMLPS